MVKIFVCSRGGKPVSTFNWVIEYKPIPPEILNKPIRAESNLLAEQKRNMNSKNVCNNLDKNSTFFLQLNTFLRLFPYNQMSFM